MPTLAKQSTPRKLIHGIGINDADYVVHPNKGKGGVNCIFYRTWSNMITRCYSSAYHRVKPTYIGCTVCDEWISFMTFRAWMIDQDWEGNELDKDILFLNNKYYSPENCIFVSQEVNSLLIKCDASRGEYPVGVCKNHNKFEARLRRGGGKREYLGVYDTPEQASSAYNDAKSKYIRTIASEQVDPRISAGLLRHADIYGKGLVQ